MTEQTTPAGWYPDPKSATSRRYWDGERWTEQVAPAEDRRPVNAAANVFLLLCAVGVIVVLIAVAAALVR